MINKLVGNVIKRGKKNTSIRILKGVFLNIKNSKLNVSLDKIIKIGSFNVQPRITFSNKKIAGVVHKVPKPYENIKKSNLSSKWLAQSSKKRSGNRLEDKLSGEILESFSKKSLSFKKKISFHKLGLANRTNLKFM